MVVECCQDAANRVLVAKMTSIVPLEMVASMVPVAAAGRLARTEESVWAADCKALFPARPTLAAADSGLVIVVRTLNKLLSAVRLIAQHFKRWS